MARSGQPVAYPDRMRRTRQPQVRSAAFACSGLASLVGNIVDAASDNSCDLGIEIGAKGMKSQVVKRSVVIAGRKTSVSLEDAFWKELKEIASGRDIILSDLIAAIDSERQHGNLSSAIRLFVLEFYRNPPSGNTSSPPALPRARES
jgi:predicted DNA-binding ribbon-helix-helix protein